VQSCQRDILLTALLTRLALLGHVNKVVLLAQHALDPDLLSVWISKADATKSFQKEQRRMILEQIVKSFHNTTDAWQDMDRGLT
jgi:hypothetical protein